MMYSPVILLLCAVAAPLAVAADWHGYEKREVLVENVAGYVVLPKIAAPGKPWLWRARFMDYHPDYAVALLAKGFHVAYYDLPNVFGSPEAMDKWDRFYDHVVGRFGLSPKVALEGVSRGGLFVYNWARRNPNKVNCIYCESPVCDMKSWPGGKGKGLGNERDWRQALESYKLTSDQMLVFRDNPVDFAAQLGAARIPALHIVSERDRTVPAEENTALFAKAYRQGGGPITVHFNTSQPETSNGHHFPLDDVALPVNFILRHTPGREHLAGTGVTPHGAEYFKLREGLRNSLARFSQGGEARVAFLGGSVTNMNGWRDLVCGHLRERFPQTKFDCINAGIPSTGSTPAAFRLRRDVFGRGPVDLLFEEAAVNDPANGFGPREQVRGMEGIVRQARMLNPKIDIVLLHFVNLPNLDEYRAGQTPEAILSHERVAVQYGLASIDLAREVTERIDAGELEWDRDF
ncbi:MAG: GDSL-type esterase/lipase family protein, partial [Bryobacteraceae bacterium]